MPSRKAQGHRQRQGKWLAKSLTTPKVIRVKKKAELCLPKTWSPLQSTLLAKPRIPVICKARWNVAMATGSWAPESAQGLPQKRGPSLWEQLSERGGLWRGSWVCVCWWGALSSLPGYQGPKPVSSGNISCCQKQLTSTKHSTPAWHDLTLSPGSFLVFCSPLSFLSVWENKRKWKHPPAVKQNSLMLQIQQETIAQRGKGTGWRLHSLGGARVRAQFPWL